MTWPQLPQPIRDKAQAILTPSQLETWQLWLEATSMTPERGLRWIAQELDRDKKSISDRLERVKRKLHQNGIYQDINGNWHHTPPTSAQDALRDAHTVQEAHGLGATVETHGNAYTRKDTAE